MKLVVEEPQQIFSYLH